MDAGACTSDDIFSFDERQGPHLVNVLEEVLHFVLTASRVQEHELVVGGGYEHGYVQVVDPVSATVFRFMAMVVQRVRSAKSRAEFSRGNLRASLRRFDWAG
mgnify:CR=1 FL=1|jgi:hypothetical protein